MKFKGKQVQTDRQTDRQLQKKTGGREKETEGEKGKKREEERVPLRLYKTTTEMKLRRGSAFAPHCSFAFIVLEMATRFQMVSALL